MFLGRSLGAKTLLLGNVWRYGQDYGYGVGVSLWILCFMVCRLEAPFRSVAGIDSHDDILVYEYIGRILHGGAAIF